MYTIQTRPNAIYISGKQRTNISTNVFFNVLCTRMSNARFMKIIKGISAVYAYFVLPRAFWSTCLMYSCNVLLLSTTFNYHRKIYRFQFPWFSTSMNLIQVYFRPVLFSLLHTVLPWIRPSNVVVNETLCETLEIAKS